MSEQIEARRSFVRIIVTVIAAAYAFGCPVLFMFLILWGANTETVTAAKDFYMLASPLAGMIVGWWFAKRDESGVKT